MFNFVSQVKDEYLFQIFFLQSFVAYCDGRFREAHIPFLYLLASVPAALIKLARADV